MLCAICICSSNLTTEKRGVKTGDQLLQSQTRNKLPDMLVIMPFSTAAWLTVKWYLPEWEHTECRVLPDHLLLSLITTNSLRGH